MDSQNFGRSVAYWRERRGLTQQQLGDAVGLSRRMVQDIESGARQADPRISLVEAFAAALSIPVAELLAGGRSAARECVDQTEVAAIRAVLHRPWAQADAGQDAAALEQHVGHGWDAFQAAHYSTIGRLLPRLITEASGVEGADDARSVAYQLASATLLKFGDATTGMLAADRGLRAAETAGPLAQASAARRYADALIHLGDHAAALETALNAAGRMESEIRGAGPAGSSAFGMLMLKGCMAAAARGDAATVRSLLDSAARIAAGLPPDSNILWSSFNSTNVGLHAVSAHVALGDGAAAVDAAKSISQDHLAGLPRERRAHFMVDLATGHSLVGRSDSALLVLLAAERLAPQEVHCRAATRELVTGLVSTSRPLPEPRLRALASRCGVGA